MHNIYGWMYIYICILLAQSVQFVNKKCYGSPDRAPNLRTTTQGIVTTISEGPLSVAEEGRYWCVYMYVHVGGKTGCSTELPLGPADKTNRTKHDQMGWPNE